VAAGTALGSTMASIVISVGLCTLNAVTVTPLPSIVA
jgi:hypothetical protein